MKFEPLMPATEARIAEVEGHFGVHRMLQRDDGTLKVIPVILGIVFLLFVGYKLWPHHSTVLRSTTTSIDHLTSTTPDAPRTTPTQPQ
jgi:hypothetical protein